MAALSRAVIQLPDFAEMAYKKSLADEERRLREEEKQERKVAQRQREADAFGVRQSYAEKSFALEPAAKSVVDLAYNAFQQAGIEYEKTGSEEAKASMDRAFKQFSQVLGTGLAVSNTINQEIETVKKNPSLFTPESQLAAPKLYEQRRSMNFAPTVENGVIFINEGGKKVPITESAYFSTSLSPGVNTLGLQPMDPATKYLNIEDTARDFVGTFINSEGVKIDDGRNVRYNMPNLITKVKSVVESDFKNKPSFAEAAIIRHWTNINGKAPTAQERETLITEYKSSPERLNAAKEAYTRDLVGALPKYGLAAQRGVTPQPSEPSKRDEELSFFLENSKPTPGVFSDGRRAIRFISPPIKDIEIDNFNYTIKEVSFDKKGTPSMVITDSEGNVLKNDSKEFKSAYKEALIDMKPYLSKLRAISMNELSRKQPLP
jgi:hypothetical protein